MTARQAIWFCSLASLALWQSVYGQGSIGSNGGQTAASTKTIPWIDQAKPNGGHTAASTNTISWDDLAKPSVTLPADAAGPIVSHPPGVLSTTPVVVAMVCVALFCLAGAGKMFVQKNLRSARHWLAAAVTCLALWGLMVLFVEAVGLP